MSETKYTNLTTEYMDKMDRDIPWADYPRPSMVRDSYICLNGKWDFCVNESDAMPDSYGEQILVPFPPESPLSGIERNIPESCFLHYKKCFTLPDGFNKGKVILHFGAVDNICDVYVNGTHAVYHDGGYLPFHIDITDMLNIGENELYVRVKDDLSGLYPYGKQKRERGGMWYTPISGIWQTVWLESVPHKYIKSIRVTPTTTNVKIEVKGGESKKIITLDSGEIYEFEGNEITISPINKHLWTPENPNLYRFTLESGKDKIESYFALREIGIKKVKGIPRITLNGKPYLFNGLLDQGYYSDGIFLPATSYGYEEDIIRIKKMGFNMLRKHIKVEPEIFYNLCDRLGVVVFQDMVNNSDYSFFIDTALPTVGFKRLPILFRHKDKREREIFTRDMYGTMDHLHFFPSVMYYTIFNEGWGQFCADKMYDAAKAHDPTRIIDATSGWFWRKRSDVDSRHVYFKKVKIGHLGKKPIVISEFGGYAHRVEGHLFGEGNYGYNTYESREEFENLFDKLYLEEIKPLISKGICALVYTQVSDVEDETNGLITYDRRVVKLHKSKTKEIMNKLYDEMNK